MTSPAAAARRQYALDRLVEDLVGWGCPLDSAENRAAVLLGHVTDAGYALPASIADAAPPPAAHSTAAGRVRAKILFAHHRAVDEWLPPRYPVDEPPTVRARCACRAWTGQPLYVDSKGLDALLADDHDQHLAAMLVVAGVATHTETTRARQSTGEAIPGPTAGSGSTNTRPPVPVGPEAVPEAHAATQREA
jgi:hypothetical protein